MQALRTQAALALALLATVAAARSQAAAPSAAPEFAIRNAMRPGAKASPCPEQGSTPDGCTFHTIIDQVNRARLPLADGASWVARTPDSALVRLQDSGVETAADGARYQLIDIIPTQPEDADITVTFDKLSTDKTPVQLTERRRVTVMKHSEHSWHEH